MLFHNEEKENTLVTEEENVENENIKKKNRLATPKAVSRETVQKGSLLTDFQLLSVISAIIGFHQFNRYRISCNQIQ